MRVAILFSGGKDSTFALKVALEQGWDVRYLVTMVSERDDSWMFHHPCIEQTKLQSQAVGIKQLLKTTSGVKEEEVKDLVEVLLGIKDEIDGVVSGALASRYQKDRIDALCKELDLRSIAPLWGKNQQMFMQEIVDSGMDAIIVGVSCEGMGKEWLGRIIDSRAINDLQKLNERFGINVAGEGGEFETFVMDAPFFKKRIVFGEMEKKWDAETNSGYIICKNAKLIDK